MLRLSPRELILSELPALLPFWERSGGPGDALKVLSAWAGLRRLAGGWFDEDERALQTLIEADGVRLVRAVCGSPPPDVEGWLRWAGEIDLTWDAGDVDAEEVEWRTRCLFEDLDRLALAAWAVRKIIGESGALEWLTAARESLAKMDDFLAARPDLFLCVATEVTEALWGARPGLEDEEPALFETLCRHRRVEEVRDEVELPPRKAALLRSAVGVNRG